MKFTQKEKDFALRLLRRYSRKRTFLETPIVGGLETNPDFTLGDIASSVFFTGMLSTGMLYTSKDESIFQRYLNLKAKRTSFLRKSSWTYHSLSEALQEREERTKIFPIKEENLNINEEFPATYHQINKTLLLKNKRLGKKIRYSLVPKRENIEKEIFIPFSNRKYLISQPAEERKTIFSKIKGFFTNLLLCYY